MPKTYVIGMPPTNSTGDIYHIISFIVLMRSYNKEIPTIILAHDTSGTKSQVDRCVNFAKQLGYGRYFFTLPIECSAYRHKVREIALKKITPDYFPGNEVCFIEQKALTKFISEEFYNDKRRTINYLINGYAQRDLSLTTIDAELKARARMECKKIKQYHGDDQRPLIILHTRFSSGANDNLNFNVLDIFLLHSYFNNKGYKIWFLTTGDHPCIKNCTNKTFLFNNEVVDKLNGDYGKLFHINLLFELKKLNNVKIIGNTSGLLDVAAFLDLDVYDLHRFKIHLYDEQEMRVCVGFNFLSVENLDWQDYIMHLLSNLGNANEIKIKIKEIASIMGCRDDYIGINQIFENVKTQIIYAIIGYNKESKNSIKLCLCQELSRGAYIYIHPLGLSKFNDLFMNNFLVDNSVTSIINIIGNSMTRDVIDAQSSHVLDNLERWINDSHGPEPRSQQLPLDVNQFMQPCDKYPNLFFANSLSSDAKEPITTISEFFPK